MQPDDRRAITTRTGPVRTERPGPEQLRAIRLALGLSQTHFARLLGVRLREVQRWEAGQHRPTALRLEALNRLLEEASRALGQSFPRVAAAS